MNDEIILGVWETVRVHIPEKKRSDAAIEFVQILKKNDFEYEDLMSLDHEIFPELTAAIDLVFEEYKDLEEDDFFEDE